MTRYESEEMKERLPLLSFQVITDTHLTTSPTHAYNVNFERALQDICSQAPASLGIMHIGDVTDHGYSEEYKEMLRIYQKYREYLPPIHFTLGNHDVGLGDFTTCLNQFLSYTNTPAEYHDHWIEGFHFIFLGTEEGLEIFCTLSDKQLSWLEEKLSEQASEQPIFVFLHQPLVNTVAGSSDSQNWYGVTEDKQLREILRKYPQVILFTGHTHWEMESKHTLHYDPTQPEGPMMLNAASTAYLWNDQDEPIMGSQGYYVEVYPDEVKIKGRDFLRRKWIPTVEFTIPLNISEQKDISAS